MTEEKTRPHSRATRLFHLAIALLVISQLATSRVMTSPKENREEDWLFEIHEYTGLVAFFVIAGFWLFTMYRLRGTRRGVLYPWFSRESLAALATDAKRHGQAFMKLRVPEHIEHAPLASAIHGLGILLVLLMACTGVTWFIGMQLGDMAHVWAEAAKEIHEFFSNVVWIYLFGHAGIALINHFAGKQSLTDMWSAGTDG